MTEPRILNQEMREVPLAEVQPHPENPRRGNLDVIRESVRDNGFYGAVVVQRSTGYIIAGNHRYKALEAEGASTLPVIYVDVDDIQAKKILAADNRTSDLGTYDDDVLSKLLKEVSAHQGSLEGTGYTDKDLAKLLAGVVRENVDEDEAPEPPAQPVTQHGDIWIMGQHRLVCGDSRARLAAAACLNGEKPNLCVADPPYGVEYVGGMHARVQRRLRGEDDLAALQNDDVVVWTDALVRFPGDVLYNWHADIFAAATSHMIEKISFDIRAQIIWKKPSAPISRGHYNWGHEPCWYAVRKGSNASWIGKASENTVWEFSAPGADDEKQVGHPTQKPVGLIVRSIGNHQGDVYDPFAGSGTVFIAAHQLERRAFGIEIDPKWCDVTVERWEQYTGEKAQRKSLGV